MAEEMKEAMTNSAYMAFSESWAPTLIQDYCLHVFNRINKSFHFKLVFFAFFVLLLTDLVNVFDECYI